jgi:quercetin dioxygenase-like cupin family protein
MDVQRYDESPLVVRDGDGAFTPSRDNNHDPHFVIRHMLSRHARGELEMYCVDLDANLEREAAPHSSGVLEHVFVVTGRIEIQLGEETRVLCEGDRMTFLADTPHVYRETEGRSARAVVLLDYP